MDICQWTIEKCDNPIAKEDSSYRRNGQLDNPFCDKHLDYHVIGERHAKLDKGELLYRLVEDFEDCKCPYHIKKSFNELSALAKSLEDRNPLPQLPKAFPKTPEAYKNHFGKSFRMTADQSKRKISREEAYAEFYNEQPEAQEYEKVLAERQKLQKEQENVLPFTPDAYRKKFGKRFKITKDQSDRGLDRQQAYDEFRDANNGIFPVMVKKVRVSKKIERQSKIVNKTKIKDLMDYVMVTGKRFRMTRDQKERNLTRQEAFEEWKLVNS